MKRFSQSIAVFEEAIVTPAPVLFRKRRHTITSNLLLWFVPLLALQLALFPALAEGRPAPQAQAKQPLGSLASVGQVYVGNSVAPAESTIFTGDTLRTGEASTAKFTISGKGSFQIASGSQLVFTGSQQYVAELKSGIVVMSSSSGASGINLRVGNFVVAAVTEDRQSTAEIEGSPNGSFVVRCSEGSVGVIPVEGPLNGTFLQAGQSVTISPQGELSGPTGTAISPSTSPSTPPAPPVQGVEKSNRTRWIILGLAGAGGAVGAGVALGSGGGGQPVSPSVP
jgi:hypothetical protein